jgi:DGQHR domain-containing protein
MKVPAIRIRQDGQTLYVTAIQAGQLISHSKPDAFREEDGEEHGYQRVPERPRALAMARFLRGNQVLLPTAVTLGAREELKFDEKTGTLEIPEESTLFEVDGQHRLAGFRIAIQEQGIQRLSEFPLVATIIDNSSEILEAEQFRTINETSKKVRTDLARRILARMAHQLRSPFRVIDVGRKWEVRATEIIGILKNDPESPFYNRIQAPNQKKLSTHTIKEQSFGDSLRPLLTSHPFDGYNPEAVAEGLNEFWRAWKRIMDEAQDHEDNPFLKQDFVLLKAIPGVFALHLVCRYLWTVFERRGQRFRAGLIFEALKKAGEEVGGGGDEDFTTRWAWHSHNNRGFALYGGLKGAKGLSDLIIEYLKEAGYTFELPQG